MISTWVYRVYDECLPAPSCDRLERSWKKTRESLRIVGTRAPHALGVFLLSGFSQPLMQTEKCKASQRHNDRYMGGFLGRSFLEKIGVIFWILLSSWTF